MESKYSWLKPGDIVTVSISGIGTLETNLFKIEYIVKVLYLLVF